MLVIIISLFLVGIAIAAYIITAPSSVPVTVNPPNNFLVGPGWSFP
jgi:hypothetical protein